MVLEPGKADGTAAGAAREENAAVNSSKMTRAVVATGFGGPEVLSAIETPVGPLGPGEVLIDVRAAGTNPIDYKLYSGAVGRDPASCRCAWASKPRAW
jgi:hypothetical protein